MKTAWPRVPAYERDPLAVDERWRAYFADQHAVKQALPIEVRLGQYIRTYQQRGHLAADARALPLRSAHVDVLRMLRPLLWGLEHVALDAEAGVRTVLRLGREAQRRAVGAARLVGRAVRAARVPREAHRHRARVRLLVDEALADAGLDGVDVEGGADARARGV